MRFLKVLVIAMGVLILSATTLLVVIVARRIGGAGQASVPGALLLDELPGARIVGIAQAGDRLAIQLQGGGADRVVLLDPRTGAVTGRIVLHDAAQ